MNNTLFSAFGISLQYYMLALFSNFFSKSREQVANSYNEFCTWKKDHFTSKTKSKKHLCYNLPANFVTPLPVVNIQIFLLTTSKRTKET